MVKIKRSKLNIKTVIMIYYREFYLLKEAFMLGASEYIVKNEIHVNQFIEILNRLKEEIMLEKDMAENQNVIVNGAKKYIRINYCKNISLSDAARYLNVNKSYLSRLFRQKTGMTLVDYLTKIRIENAIKLIKNTNLRIYEIAEKVGYENVEHFSRVLKKRVGVSPKEYMDSNKVM